MGRVRGDAAPATPHHVRINSNLRADQREAIKSRLRGEFADLFAAAAAAVAPVLAPAPAAAAAAASVKEEEGTGHRSVDASALVGPPPSASDPKAEETATPAIAAPIALSWYPAEGECWQLGAQMKQIRKVDALRACHDFLVHANDVGDISRQEVVSMLPPLLLGVQPHHKVLDMCAAPGSKTIQLVEALRGRSSAGLNRATGEHERGGGFLVANDNNLKRTYMLIHRVQALKNPAFAVTQHEAQNFPTIFSRGLPHETGATPPSVHPAPILFDRVLCDVPYSGDGTLRKISTSGAAGESPRHGNAPHSEENRPALRWSSFVRAGDGLLYLLVQPPSRTRPSSQSCFGVPEASWSWSKCHRMPCLACGGARA